MNLDGVVISPPRLLFFFDRGSMWMHLHTWWLDQVSLEIEVAGTGVPRAPHDKIHGDGEGLTPHW